MPARRYPLSGRVLRTPGSRWLSRRWSRPRCSPPSRNASAQPGLVPAQHPWGVPPAPAGQLPPLRPGRMPSATTAGMRTTGACCGQASTPTGPGRAAKGRRSRSAPWMPWSGPTAVASSPIRRCSMRRCAAHRKGGAPLPRGARQRDLRQRRPRPGDTWHPGAVFIGIHGVQHYRWRAVDRDGTVLDILVQRRRDKRAAGKSFRRLLAVLASVPRVIITDMPASDGAAKRVVLPSVEHRQHQRRNNRAENAQQPTKERERQMRWLKRPGHAQRFLATHGPLLSHCRPRCLDYRRTRAERLRHLAGRHRHLRPGPSRAALLPSASPCTVLVAQRILKSIVPTPGFPSCPAFEVHFMSATQDNGVRLSTRWAWCNVGPVARVMIVGTASPVPLLLPTPPPAVMPGGGVSTVAHRRAVREKGPVAIQPPGPDGVARAGIGLGDEATEVAPAARREAAAGVRQIGHRHR